MTTDFQHTTHHLVNQDDPVEHELEDELGPESDPAPFKLFFRFLKQPWAKYCIISTWVLVLILGLFFAPLLLEQTQLTINSPETSDSYVAKEKMEKSFKILVGSNYVLLFSQCLAESCINGSTGIEKMHEGGSSACNYQCLQKKLLARYKEYDRDHGGQFYNFTDLYTSLNVCTTYADIEYNSYALALENQTCVASVRESFLSGDGLSAITVIQHKDNINDAQRHSLLNWLDDIQSDFGGYSAGRINTRYTGEIALWNDMQEESKKTIESHLYLVPLILLIFGYTIGSWRLTLIPIIAMVICVNIAFMLLLPFTQVVTVSTMTPTLMTSIALAMCIDYNLFMLVRFREEIGDERETLRMSEVFEALRKTIRWSGEVVLVSGFILALSLMGYIFCSVEFLQSYGLGTAITVGCAISINLTLTPSILLLFPSFFTQFGFNCRRTIIIDDSDAIPQTEETTDESNAGDYGTNQSKALLEKEHSEAEASLVGADETEKVETGPQKAEKEPTTQGAVSASQSKYMDFIVNNDDPFRPFEVTPADEANAFQRCWFVCGTWTTLFPCSLLIIAIVYALILPITVMTGQIEISYAQTLEVPRDSTHWKTFERIQDHFSAGLIGPMYLLIRAPSGMSVFDYSYINATSTFYNEVIRNLNGSVGQIDHVNGVSVMGGKFLGGNGTAKYQYNNYVNSSRLYHALVDGYVGHENAESYFVMLTHNDPNGLQCKRIVNKMRDVINPACKKILRPFGYRCYFYSNTVETIDAIHDLYTTFPWILLVTMVIIFIIAGVIWKNKFLPLRLFLTIAMPMFMIYGLAVLVYQYNWLSWLGAESVKNTGGISWIIPLMTITLLFGLALDYDIFLWSRIDEYMKHGVPLRPAIVRGVFKTGSIITAAGLIMAAAFSGLFLSSVPGLNQAGFIMVSSVLVDTFLIRTTLVPSILSISMTLTWHPKWQQRIYGWFGWPIPVNNYAPVDHRESETDKDTDKLLDNQ